MARERGQAIVEMALVLPIILFVFLAMGEFAFAFASAHSWQRGADVLADAAAIRMSSDTNWRVGWEGLAQEEQERAVGCGRADVTLLDGSDEPGNRVLVSWECQYDMKLLNGFSFPATTIESVSVIPPTS